MNKSRNVFILVTILFLSIIFSYIILEDTLGGAKHDFTFHEKFVILFAEDFKNTFRDYGKGELLARNSPIFYIFLSLIYKSGIEIDKIKYLNITSIIYDAIILRKVVIIFKIFINPGAYKNHMIRNSKTF